MPYVLLALAVGVVLAQIAKHDRASVESERDGMKAQLDEVQQALTQAKLDGASKEVVAVLTIERDELKQKLAALEAGERAQNPPMPTTES